MSLIDQARSTPLRDRIYTATEVIKFQAKRIEYRVALLLYEIKLKSLSGKDAETTMLNEAVSEELKIQYTRAEILRDLMKRVTEKDEFRGRTSYPMHN